MSTVVYMCLEWPWGNGVFFRDSAGIRRGLYRTLFGLSSDFHWECSDLPRGSPNNLRTLPEAIPAQTRNNTEQVFYKTNRKVTFLPLSDLKIDPFLHQLLVALFIELEHLTGAALSFRLRILVGFVEYTQGQHFFGEVTAVYVAVEQGNV
jgi:hypothetical protein